MSHVLPAHPHPTAHCKACHRTLAGVKSLGQVRKYDLLRCPDCATVTTDPWPTAEDLREYYQDYTPKTNYKGKKDKKIARAKNRIAKIMDMAPGKSFLDVGCRYGSAVKAARDLGFQAHGIDTDAAAVNASRAAFGAYYETISVQDYAARGEKADIVYASEVIDKALDPQGFMAAVSQILNPQGILFLTCPDAGHFAVPHEFISWTKVMPPEHLTYFTQKGLRLLCQKNGLQAKRFGFRLKPVIRMIAQKPLIADAP